MDVEYLTESALGPDAGEGSNTADLLNFFPETVKSGGRSRLIFRPCPDLETQYEIPDSSKWVKIHQHTTQYGLDFLVVSVGNEVGTPYFGADAFSVWATLPDEPQGFTSINGDLAVRTAVGRSGFPFKYGVLTPVFNAELGGPYTFSPQPTPIATSGRPPKSMTTHRGRVVSADTSNFYWSDLVDPTTHNALQFASAESSPDNIEVVVGVGEYLYILGNETTEVWRISGQAGVDAYNRPTIRENHGLLSRRLFSLANDLSPANSAEEEYFCETGDGVFFINQNSVPVLAIDGRFQEIYHPGVVSDIEDTSRIGVKNPFVVSRPVSRLFYYEFEGHRFCVIRFNDRPAWVYDISMNMWHRRSTGGGAWEVVNVVGRDTPSAHVLSADGSQKIATFVRKSNASEMRSMTTLPIEQGGERYNVGMLGLRGEMGDNDHDIQISLELSPDGGRTWSQPIPQTVEGSNFQTLARWRALGQYQTLTCRFSYSGSADVALYSQGEIEIA